MSLAEFAEDQEEPTVPLSSLQAKKNEVETLKRALGKKEKERQEYENRLNTLLDITEAQSKPPKWTTSKRKINHKAIANLMVSDTHFDEVVDPAEVDGLNAYNREIAEKRLKKTFEKSIMLTRDHLSGVKYEGAVSIFGGDMVTGTIHEELAQTNDAYMPETILHWSAQLSAGVEMLREEFKKVHIPCCVGNHGRGTRKPRMKGRVKDNWDWLIYKLVARDFRDEDDVTFQIPDSADCRYDVYDSTFLLTHGDQFKGGGGVAGIISPIARGDHRKRKRHMETDRPFDYMVMGHWHSLSFYRKIIINGSTKGYDEYAYINNLDYEPAQQAFWITTPEHGITFTAPIFVEDRKAEKW